MADLSYSRARPATSTKTRVLPSMSCILLTTLMSSRTVTLVWNDLNTAS